MNLRVYNQIPGLLQFHRGQKLTALVLGFLVFYGAHQDLRFDRDKELTIDYKDPQMLKYFTTERGKIVPRRISGNCAKHQRQISLAIKRSRMIALMPFTVTGK